MSDYAERNAEIIRRREAGEYCWQIAREMGVSRNAVIGVCHRAGVHLHDRLRAISAEMVANGPGGRGRGLHNAKLDANLVRSARARYVFGSREDGTTALAKVYGVAPKTMWDAVTGKTWKHVA